MYVGCRSNARGDMMLSALNLTSHLHMDGVYYQMPDASSNDKLASDSPEQSAAAVENGASGAQS